MEKTLHLGKIDYYGTGRRINAVDIIVNLDYGDISEDNQKPRRLSITGDIWNMPHTDIVSGGQNLEEIGKLFPRNKKVQRIVEVWKRWHLNDMRAGSPAQEEWLREYGRGRDYTETLERLANVGLAWDNDVDGYPDGYKYGSAWLTEELPDEIIAEVESW